MNTSIYISVTNFLKKRTLEFIGLCLISIGVLLSISFITYSPSDPSLIYGPEKTAIKNFFGIYGSIVSDFLLQSFGLVSFLLLITIIGWLSLSFIGKKFIDLLNNILKKIPILRTIYSAIGQMTESFTKSDNKQKSVVLLEYPRKGVWAVGFATKENTGIIKDKVKEELINVFVPTTPNPTSGFLLMVPKTDLIYLDVTFEQASKFIVSAGTTNIN